MLRGLITIILGLILSCSCAIRQTPAETESIPSQTSLSESELDQALQRVATEALGERDGAVIVIDPQNGRLRAVVNPRLAFEQAFPPGSAIKPFTALAAMRAGLIDREDRHQCRTRYARDDFEIVCSHPRSNSPFNLAQALAYSCNDYFARVGERLSEGAFNSTLSSFGFGEKTGINASEAAGRLPRGDWRAQHALGESDHLLVTPIQLIAAYAALANGGRLHRPQRSTDHGLVAQEKMRLNLAPAHREVLIEGMRGSVKYGTAAKAALSDSPGYVFGKTGTSTASNRWRTQGWFVGFAAEKRPVGAPRPDQIKLAALVFLKRAHGSQCAEVAKPILECGLRIADCGLKKSGGPGKEERAEKPGIERSSISNLKSQISNPQSPIRVRSISENVTRELPLEEYLVGVLTGEASIEDETEALKAQAVVSRTFALKNRNRHAREGYDFCSTTHCQRFVLAKANNAGHAAARRAVEQTAGEALQDQSRRIVDAYFHAACGGVTANIETLWGAPAPSYLRGVRDDFCATMPHRRWMQAIPADQLAKAVQSDERTNVGAKLDSITVSKRDATGRAETITIAGARRRVVRGWDFKIIVGRALGWQMIKSSRFEVARAGNEFVFRGGGFGHGLGLCQEGAHVAARRGMSYRQILNHYFPETRLARATPERSATQVSAREALVEVIYRGSEGGAGNRTLSSEHFRASFPANANQRSVENVLRLLEAARADLLRRLEKASLRIAEAQPFEVVIHATTASFVEATGQSGWAAGVTRGRRIELQPLDLLLRRGMLAATLRHELTHAVIEALSGGRAPRWMAEGMAIHVAGEGAALSRVEIKSQVSREELERRLARPASVAEMRELYALAYREVRAMIQSEGESKVWQRLAKSPGPRAGRTPLRDKKMTDKKIEDKKMTDKKIEDKKIEDKKIEDKKMTDKKIGDRKMTDKKIGDRKMMDKKMNYSQEV